MLRLDNVHCAACVEKIRSRLNELSGLTACEVNAITGHARISWVPGKTDIDTIKNVLSGLGYPPRNETNQTEKAEYVREQRRAVSRIAVAGLAMVQVMMFAVAMYFGAFSGMDADTRYFLRLVSLLVATPVVFYSATPFFANAYHDLASGHTGMDVPVSLAIAAAYVASVWSTFTGGQEVYFDSLAMFVFFLSIGRYLESKARYRVGKAGRELAALLPELVVRTKAGARETVPIQDLEENDEIIVVAGAVFPADGVLVGGPAHLDESMLTGEAKPRRADEGEPVYAGTSNAGAPVTVRVTCTGDATVLSNIQRLVQHAESSRPRIANIANRVAGFFTLGVLLVATATAVSWWNIDSASALPVTLSVLVVTCPCALALAVPAAVTAATGAFVKRGMLVVNPDAIETLDKITDFVFDKTGTLTEGKFRLVKIITENDQSRDRVLSIAATLERNASHPLAGAFAVAGDETATDLEVFHGRGMEGSVSGRRYRIGSPDFIRQWRPAAKPPPGKEEYSWVGLATKAQMLAWFAVGDVVRSGAPRTLQKLRDAGYALHLLSGDAVAVVGRVAQQVGISNFHGRLLPEAKLAYLRNLQQQGRKVVMIGDGINDGPVLAGANVSVAMASGSSVAHSSADLLYTRQDFDGLLDALEFSRRARRVTHQNLAWALLYNVLAVPAAVMGLVAPWMAAIGMSSSSLLVVTNALRLARSRT